MLVFRGDRLGTGAGEEVVASFESAFSAPAAFFVRALVAGIFFMISFII
jgi:hypothetical protein